MFKCSSVFSYVSSPLVKLTILSRMLRESLRQPSLFCAMICSAVLSAFIFSFSQISCKCSTVSLLVILLKSKIWQRDRIVGSILCFSVVAKIKMANGGGSSSVLRNALKAAELSMCTSSTIYTLYLPACGANLTCSTKVRMSSTELLLAASSSWILRDEPSLNETQDGHLLQASPPGPTFSQLMVLARIRAQVVFPTPRGP